MYHLSIRLRLALAAAAITLSVTACDDSTSPAADFEPSAMAETMAEMTAVTEGLDDALHSVAMATEQLGLGASADVSPYLSTGTVDMGALRAPPEPSASVLPLQHLGKTFIWDTDAEMYVEAAESAAPGDAIRVLYYAIDPVTEQPAKPLNALGYVELRDLSTEASNRLSVRAVYEPVGESPVTLADYWVDVAFAITQASLTYNAASQGYFSNGTDQLNFQYAEALSVSDAALSLTQSFDADLEGTDHAVSLAMSLTGDPSAETGTLEMTAGVTNGAESLAFSMAIDEQQVVDGQVLYQGDAVASIAGTVDAPVFTDRNGDPLTQAQIEELGRLWEGVFGMFDLAEGFAQEP
jgi:archaellin